MGQRCRPAGTTRWPCSLTLALPPTQSTAGCGTDLKIITSGGANTWNVFGRRQVNTLILTRRRRQLLTWCLSFGSFSLRMRSNAPEGTLCREIAWDTETTRDRICSRMTQVCGLRPWLLGAGLDRTL